MRAAIGNDDDQGIEGQDERPPQQRAFLSTPDGRQTEHQGHVAASMLGDVVDLVILHQEQQHQNPARQGRQPGGGDGGLLAAGNQFGIATARAVDARPNGEDGCREA